MRFDDGQTILFTGDSITDCDRAHPIGAGGGLGNGYVSLVDSLLSVWYPQRVVRVLNSGGSGDRITDLEARWETDVLAHEPDWLSIMIGINDVWRQFDNIARSDQVDIQQYESTYRRLLERARPGLAGLVLMTPFYVETNLSDPMRSVVDKYGAVVGGLAADFDAVLVNIQTEFDRILESRPTQSLCGDRVHPNATGHLVIAKAFLNDVKFEWGPV